LNLERREGSRKGEGLLGASFGRKGRDPAPKNVEEFIFLRGKGARGNGLTQIC